MSQAVTDDTETPDPQPAPVVIGAAEVDHTNDLVPFLATADDEVTCTATKPKMAILLKVLAALGDENPLTQALALDQLLGYVVDEPSAVHLRTRFEDPKDDLDILFLGDLMQTMVGRWFGDPTGAVSGSRRSQKRTGGSSTARRRSKG